MRRIGDRTSIRIATGVTKIPECRRGIYIIDREGDIVAYRCIVHVSNGQCVRRRITSTTTTGDANLLGHRDGVALLCATGSDVCHDNEI